jgi:hypothetical protein
MSLEMAYRMPQLDFLTLRQSWERQDPGTDKRLRMTLANTVFLAFRAAAFL